MDSSTHKENAEQAGVGEVTRILQNWTGGDGQAVDQLMPIVVNELRRIARKSIRKYTYNQSDDSLQATALVNEAYIKLRNVKQSSMTRRADFYALCAGIIKHIIIDYLRHKCAARRGGGVEAEPLDDVLKLSWISDSKGPSLEDSIMFQEILSRLEVKYARESQVLILKHYVGLTDEEVAEALGTSVPTVRRDLTFAMAWIRREMDTVTSEIFKSAANIKDATARKDYLDRVCGGKETLLKDVIVLLKKVGSAGKPNSSDRA